MIIFETINEIAVLGTAFLMLAVAIVWYGSVGKLSIDTSVTHSAQQTNIRLAVFLACAIVIETVLAYLLILAPVLSLSLATLSSLTLLSFISILTLLTVWEGKTRMYFFSHIGFIIVFVVGSMVVLEYWPW